MFVVENSQPFSNKHSASKSINVEMNKFVFRMETFSYETIVSRGQIDEFLFNTRWSLNCFSKYKILGEANKLKTREFFRRMFRTKRVFWITTIRLQPKKIFCIFPEVIRFHHQNEKLRIYKKFRLKIFMSASSLSDRLNLNINDTNDEGKFERYSKSLSN